MPILGSFNGVNIVSLPCDTVPGVLHPSSITWDPQEIVSVSVGTFTGQTQTYDWQNSYWEGQVSFPPMNQYDSDQWSSFILQCRGQMNAFQFGDPKAVLPKGSALGSPVVSGSNQTGYSLNTRGWINNGLMLLLPGDYIQIGYRLYKNLNVVTSDGSGNATLSIWPNLRDLPADGTTIQTKNCKGLFSLKANNGNKFSVNPGLYGFTGLAIRERI